MAKLNVVSHIITMLVTLTLGSAYPSMTSSDRHPASSATPAVNLNLNRGTITPAQNWVYQLECWTTEQLNDTIAKNNLDSLGWTILLSMVESHSQPEIPNSIITDAQNCQNLHNVLNITDSVLSEYITLVKAIPNYCFDYNIIARPLRSLKVKVQRILGTVGQGVFTDDQNITTRDTMYTVQTLVSLKAQAEKMIRIFISLQSCTQ